MSLTQHELVSNLGISRGTLHRILTNSPLVKGTTRERVLKQLEKLNYTPNAIARGLKTRKTKSIGVIGPGAIRMANIDKINAVHLAAREHGYSVIFSYSDGSSEQDMQCIRELRSRMVDGFIALGRGLPQSVPHYQTLIDDGIPLVTLYPVPGLDADCVYVDTRKAYAELTGHLISLGHTKIGLLLDASQSQYTINRELGFRDAMKKARIKVNEDWVIHVAPDGVPPCTGEEAEKLHWNISDYQHGFLGTSQLLALRHRPTALVCFSDEYAIGALRATDLAKVSVPDELALVGYDDREAAEFARIPLTTMHQPDDQGTTAVALLLKRIEESTAGAKPIVKSLSASLVIRESCGAKIAPSS